MEKSARTASDSLNRNDDRDYEIDLSEIFEVLGAKYKQIILASIMSGATFFLASLFFADVYTASTLLAPANKSEGGLEALARQYRGIASVAGISLPDGEDDAGINRGLALLQSRKFLGDFVERHNILPELIAAKSWDRESNRINFRKSLYSEDEMIWVRDVRPPYSAKPSRLEAYEAFSDILNVSVDAETGFITIELSHYSPTLAARWLGFLVDDLNQEVRRKDVLDASRSIEFLNKQLEATSLADLQKMIFELIQAQTEKMMLAEVRVEYVFETIDPPVSPEKRSSIGRIIIGVVGLFLGLLLGSIKVLLQRF